MAELLGVTQAAISQRLKHTRWDRYLKSVLSLIIPNASPLENALTLGSKRTEKQRGLKTELAIGLGFQLPEKLPRGFNQ